MTENRKQLLALIASDPEIRHLAPIFQVLLELPQRTVRALLGLGNLWLNLPYDRRAILAVILMECEKPTLERIAELCGVNRRTLYKSERFTRFYARLRHVARNGRPPDDVADDGSDEDSSGQDDD